jgi:hypothetical protein
MLSFALKLLSVMYVALNHKKKKGNAAERTHHQASQYYVREEQKQQQQELDTIKILTRILVLLALSHSIHPHFFKKIAKLSVMVPAENWPHGYSRRRNHD